jgi:hypothetical protein
MAANFVWVETCTRGHAERVAGVELRGNDLHRDFSFGGVLRQEMSDSGDSAFIAAGAGFGRVVGTCRKRTAEVGVDFAGECV